MSTTLAFGLGSPGLGSALGLGDTLCLLLLWEEGLAQGRYLTQGAGTYLPCLLVSAKILFAHEKHSYAEAVTGDVLVVPLAGADLLAILIRIAGEGHSRTVEVPVLNQVPGQALLHRLHDFW